jgi:hypothetical protein
VNDGVLHGVPARGVPASPLSPCAPSVVKKSSLAYRTAARTGTSTCLSFGRFSLCFILSGGNCSTAWLRKWQSNYAVTTAQKYVQFTLTPFSMTSV